MNIFRTDNNPAKAAEYLCDKHVVKMIVESCQLLCTALHVHNYHPDWAYKATHINHPSAIWCRQSSENYTWLCQHVDAMNQQYTLRYHKQHACSSLIDRLKNSIS